MKNLNLNYDTLKFSNQVILEKFKSSNIMQLLDSDIIAKTKNRNEFLSCIQTFSNYFQKIMMLRLTFSENSRFSIIAQNHFDEEYGHNLILLKERNYNPEKWDPILDSCAAWFTWKMFTLDNIEKVFLIHLVLEACAELFFQKANHVMKKFNETTYFNIHDEHDSRHSLMGEELLKNLRSEEYESLHALQAHSWDVMFTICDRIAELTAQKSTSI